MRALLAICALAASTGAQAEALAPCTGIVDGNVFFHDRRPNVATGNMDTVVEFRIMLDGRALFGRIDDIGSTGTPTTASDSAGRSFARHSSLLPHFTKILQQGIDACRPLLKIPDH